MRLVNLLDIEEDVVEANYVRVVDTVVCKIEVKYNGHEESIYLKSDDMDLVLNGISLGR